MQKNAIHCSLRSGLWGGRGARAGVTSDNRRIEFGLWHSTRSRRPSDSLEEPLTGMLLAMNNGIISWSPTKTSLSHLNCGFISWTCPVIYSNIMPMRCATTETEGLKCFPNSWHRNFFPSEENLRIRPTFGSVCRCWCCCARYSFGCWCCCWVFVTPENIERSSRSNSLNVYFMLNVTFIRLVFHSFF